MMLHLRESVDFNIFLSLKYFSTRTVTPFKQLKNKLRRQDLTSFRELRTPGGQSYVTFTGHSAN